MLQYHVAERVRQLRPSPTLAVSDRARALRQQGIDVIDLGGGDPDFPTPTHICQAAADAMFRGETHYVASAGIPELRRAIARKLQAENRIPVTPDEIIVTPGGKAALFVSILALVGPGDDVLMFDPGWVSYEPMVIMAGARCLHVPLLPEENYRITREAIEAVLTPQTRLMIVNSPNNPTGRVLTREEADAIVTVAQEHDIVVISDEIYEKIIYDGREHLSLAAFPGMAERTLTVNGFSKAYAMTGWRLGYVAGPAPLIRQIMKVHSHSATCATSFAQWGGVAALEGPQDVIDAMVAAWDRRRRFVTERLNAIPGFRCPLPEGAFYAFPDVSGTGLSGQEVAQKLIEEAYVGVTPGDAFGASGSGCIRLSFATADELLERALDRIANVFGR
ncbi:pyridoxal phosphate-dependent aminotransferase [Thermomicrobium roseum]|uniref:Aminotransferase n=1 Tax=Thermomicrobium roseum (strain ATCC 27502 / DSM 5159 / P-2) TaxID=309801 RepID=B9L1P0_THERP|nr:pyridoxal phosphate-dependent aminotransferase [Thermomicrobium roseum]ACM05539.1 aspartate aminotransferase A [Thermomicrobium roseum DSM 5159]